MLLKATNDEGDLDRIHKAKKVWELFYPLACLSAQARVSISEADWLKEARAFGEAFVDANEPEDVTTYLHIFVYHYGFFLATYNGIEKFANYALEGKHSVVKRILAFNTARFSYGPAETARQQLCALLRGEIHRPPTESIPQPSRKKNWSESVLQLHPTLEDQGYVLSATRT